MYTPQCIFHKKDRWNIMISISLYNFSVILRKLVNFWRSEYRVKATIWLDLRSIAGLIENQLHV